MPPISPWWMYLVEPPESFLTIGAATGGESAVEDGDYKYIKFLSGTPSLVIEALGSSDTNNQVDILLIAGGGGGGGCTTSDFGGGGGGAGGLVYLEDLLMEDTGTLTVTIGAGGALGAPGTSGSGSYAGSNGTDSTIEVASGFSTTTVATITAAGGGGGGGTRGGAGKNNIARGLDGGSGGGSGSDSQYASGVDDEAQGGDHTQVLDYTPTGKSAMTNVGFGADGGATHDSPHAPGGGGGAGGPDTSTSGTGATGTAGYYDLNQSTVGHVPTWYTSGNVLEGGRGKEISITGSAVGYSGGGAGGGYDLDHENKAGVTNLIVGGGGGDGGKTGTSAGEAGAANTGGGGGGGTQNTVSAAGGSGIAIFRWKFQ